MVLQENMLFAGRYRLLRLLGCGGFSEVWLATDEKTSLKVAVKVYAPGSGLDEDGIRIFSEELAIVYNLNHTNLLKPQYFDESGGCPYLVLPYCERGSAQKLAGKITEEEAWQFLHDVAAGLEYLHAQEPPVIHQDIKPDNVLRNTSGTFMITDFGISTRARSTLRRSVSRTNPSGGTMEYMGPERFGEKPAPIKASDIWSLGATLFELLTGEVPFVQMGGALQMNGALVPLIEGPYSDRLKQLVKACLSKAPWDRPTAHTLREYVEAYWRGENPGLEKPAKKHLPASGQKPSGKSKWILIVLFLCILAGGICWYVLSGNEHVRLEEQKISTTDSLNLHQKEIEGRIEGIGKSVTENEKEDNKRQQEGGKRSGDQTGTREQKAEKESGVLLTEDEQETNTRRRKDTLRKIVDKEESKPRPIGNGLIARWSSSVTSDQKRVLSQLIENMVKVKGGSFQMGGTSEQGSNIYSDEKPVHTVTLSDYYICKYEVSQQEWEVVMGNNPSHFQGKDLPVEQVSWEDCQVFIQRLNTLTGLDFKLPTEAQWEYAARGGSKSQGTKYSGSNTLSEVGWFGENSGRKTHPIGQKQANELGLYDMSGNVWECCSDWYGGYSSSSEADPIGPGSGSYRVNRGGSWYGEAWLCRVSRRSAFDPGYRDSNLGLRLVL